MENSKKMKAKANQSGIKGQDPSATGQEDAANKDQLHILDDKTLSLEELGAVSGGWWTVSAVDTWLVWRGGW